jgi:hypothetical protein
MYFINIENHIDTFSELITSCCVMALLTGLSTVMQPVSYETEAGVPTSQPYKIFRSSELHS